MVDAFRTSGKYGNQCEKLLSQAMQVSRTLQVKTSVPLTFDVMALDNMKSLTHLSG